MLNINLDSKLTNYINLKSVYGLMRFVGGRRDGKGVLRDDTMALPDNEKP